MYEIIKKTWKFIVGFILGFISIISFNRIRLSGQSQLRDNNSRKDLEQLGQSIESTVKQVSNIRESDSNINKTIDSTNTTIKELRANNSNIETSSKQLGNSIQRLKQLIDSERKRIENSEKNQ